MAHFAKLGIDNVVIEVLALHNNEMLDENGVEQEINGLKFLRELTGHYNWVQTSFSASFRKNFAGQGYTYDKQLDAFIAPKPYNSWILNEETCCWEAPIAIPSDNSKYYAWDEETTSRVVVE
jgi:hypothetical protein